MFAIETLEIIIVKADLKKIDVKDFGTKSGFKIKMTEIIKKI